MVAGTVSCASRVGAPEWDVVVGDRFIVALAAPADPCVLVALAEATGEADVGIERLVGVLPAADTDPDPGFAVVWWPGEDPSNVTAVVRGGAAVDLDSPGGSRRLVARGIHPWHLAEFRDVTGIRVTGAGTPLGPMTEAIAAVVPARTTLRATDAAWTSAPSQAPTTTTAPSPQADPDGTQHEGAAASDALLEATVAAEPDPPFDRTDPDARRADVRDDDAGAPSAFAPADPPRVRIGADGARTVTVPILVGRRPLAPRAPAAAVAPELVPVRSPTGVVSGTHLELRVEGERLVATDLRSTNGTLLTTAAGVRRMRAGESIVVSPGSSLDLGDGTIIEVLPASDDAPRPTRTDRPHS